MVFKGRKDKGASDPRVEASVREALGALLDASGVETTRFGEETGSYWELTRRANAEARKGASGAPQSFFFLNDAGERFLVVAPTATILLLLDAFLGIDVEKLCDDDALWRELCDSARKRPELTELEKEILSVAAPRVCGRNREAEMEDAIPRSEFPKGRRLSRRRDAPLGALCVQTSRTRPQPVSRATFRDYRRAVPVEPENGVESGNDADPSPQPRRDRRNQDVDRSRR